MKRIYTQDEVDSHSRDLIGRKLRGLIEAFDGSERQAKEILRGIVAAQQMGMDIREFGNALTRKSALLNDAA